MLGHIVCGTSREEDGEDGPKSQREEANERKQGSSGRQEDKEAVEKRKNDPQKSEIKMGVIKFL